MKELIVIRMNERWKNLHDKKSKIPFGESKAMRKFFAINKGSLERDYRQTLLEGSKKLQTLQDHNLAMARNNVKKRELKMKIKIATFLMYCGLFFLSYKIKGWKIDLAECEWAEINVTNLVNDTVEELNLYCDLLDDMPDVDKQKYENAEPERILNDVIKSYRQERIANEHRVSKGIVSTLEMLGIRTEQIDLIKDKKTGLAIVTDKSGINHLENLQKRTGLIEDKTKKTEVQ